MQFSFFIRMHHNRISHMYRMFIVNAVIFQCFLFQNKDSRALLYHMDQKTLKSFAYKRRLFKKTYPLPHIQIGSMGKNIADGAGPEKTYRAEGLRGMDIIAVLPS